MSKEINVSSKTQVLVVDPPTRSVSVIYSGSPGPPGPPGADGGGGGGLTIMKETDETPFGEPGFFAESSTDPVDGGWVDTDMDATRNSWTWGFQEDDSWQFYLIVNDTQGGFGIYSDGSENGYIDANVNATRTLFKLQEGPTYNNGEDIFQIFDNDGLLQMAIRGKQLTLFSGSAANPMLSLRQGNDYFQQECFSLFCGPGADTRFVETMDAAQAYHPFLIQKSDISDLFVITKEGGVILRDGSTPSAPAAGFAHIYLHNNGGSKSELRILFHTGSPIAIATEV